MRTGTALLIAVLAGLVAPGGVAVAGEGNPDPGYGTKGVAVLAVGNADRSSGEAVLLQGDRTVIAGEALDDAGGGAVLRAAVTRALADGSRDAAFGTGGQTLVPAGTGASQFFAVAPAPNDRFVAVGTAVDGGTEKVLIARFRSDGTLDDGFGTGGTVLLARGNGGVASANAVFVESDGSVVVAGHALDGGVTKLLRARVSSIGGPTEWGGLTAIGADGLTRANAIGRLGDGSFVLAGEAGDGEKKPFVARVAGSTGALTGGWGSVGDGTGLLDLDTLGGATALTVKGDQVVITGAIADGSTDVFAAAFSAASGAPDTTFGTAGRFRAAIGDGGSSVARAITTDSAGRFLLAGDASQEIGGDPVFHFMTVRLTAAGALDTSYGADGPQPGTSLALAPGGGRAFGTGLALRSDGKAVLAGRVGSGPGERLATVRYCTAEAQPCVSNTGDVALPVQSDLAMSEQCGSPDVRGVAEIAVTGGYEGRVTVEITSSDPAHFAVAPATQTVKAKADGPLPVSYTVTHSGNAADSATLTVVVRPEERAAVTRTLTVRNQVLAVGAISTATAATPRDLQPGTALTLTVPGIEVCATPGYVGGRPITVRMGNDLALASGARAGDVVTVTTPRLATTGPVELVSVKSDGKIGSRAAAPGPPVTVDTYRNTWGFAFKNFSASPSFNDMVGAFGAEDVFVCVHIPFAGCVPSGIPDPWALTVMTLLQLGDGSCFGFSWVSEQMRRGKLDPAKFTPGATTPFGIGGKPGEGDAPDVRGEDVEDEIEEAWVRQFSEEYMDFYREKSLDALLNQTPSDLRREIEGMLARGDHPLLSLRDEGSLSGQHVVNVYDVESDPKEVGAYYIHVYDNNVPFDPARVEPDGQLNSDLLAGTTLRFTGKVDSRVHVRADGSWEMPSTGFSAKQLGNVIAGPWDLPPRDAELLGPGSAAKTLINLLVVYVGEGIGNLRAQGATAAAPPATVSQITAGDKRQFTAAGGINKDPDTRLGVVPWTVATGGRAPFEGHFVPAGAPYEVKLRGDRDGKQTQVVLGDGTVSKITTSVTRGTTDTIDVAPKQNSVSFDPAGAAEPVTIEMAAETKRGTWRTALLNATTRGTDGLRYDRAADGYVIDHKGPATTVSLTLSSLEKTAAPQEATARISVGRNQKVTFKPASWKRLAGGRLTVRQGGKTRRVALRRSAASTLKMGRPTVRRRGATRTATVALTVPGGPATDSGKVTYVVRRGKKRIGTRTVSAGRPGRRTVRFTLPRATRRGDRLTVVGTAMRARAGGFTPATATRTVRVP